MTTKSLRNFVISSVILVLGTVSTASAKEMATRLGIGVRQNSALGNLPELAVSYFPSSDIGVTGGLGIDTEKDNSKFTFNGGVRRIIFKENNMNFYMGGRLGLINYETPAERKSGYELSALFGGEFFLPGLDSLGFTFEGGVGVVSTGSTRFRTLADSPFSAGVIFYF